MHIHRFGQRRKNRSVFLHFLMKKERDIFCTAGDGDKLAIAFSGFFFDLHFIHKIGMIFFLARRWME